MQRTEISWTDFSSNPLKYRSADGEVVWACIHKSEGCRNCYSEKIAARYKRGGPFTAPAMEKLTPFLDEKELRHILTYKPASGKRCFVGDMTDIFGEWVPDELLDKLFAVFALRQDVTFQILTKRPERMREYLQDDCKQRSLKVGDAIEAFGHERPWGSLPLNNVWLGCSVEDQKTADERIPLLLQAPAAVRFVSYEPALGPVDFANLLQKHTGYKDPALATTSFDALRGCGTYPSHVTGIPIDVESDHLDWVIVGGESGPGARPFNIQWARDVVKQCKAAGVACFVKQLGRSVIVEGSLDTFLHDHPQVGSWGVPQEGGLVLHPSDSKGGDWNEWPADLRVREFPKQEVLA